MDEDVRKAIIQPITATSRAVNYDFREETAQLARSQYATTRPAVLDWLKHYNEGKARSERVKPFQFYARRQEDIQTEDPDWTPKLGEFAPVAPYDTSLRKVLVKISIEIQPAKVGSGSMASRRQRRFERIPSSAGYKFAAGGGLKAACCGACIYCGGD